MPVLEVSSCVGTVRMLLPQGQPPQQATAPCPARLVSFRLPVSLIISTGLEADKVH